MHPLGLQSSNPFQNASAMNKNGKANFPTIEVYRYMSLVIS